MLENLRGSPFRAAAGPAVVVGVVLFSCIGLCTGVPCVPTGLRHGLWLEQCPATDLRLAADLSASGLVRGEWGNAGVVPWARWMDGLDRYASVETARIPRGVGVDFALLDEDGEVVPGLETRDVDWDRSGLELEIKLPEVPDGDYRLRASLDAGFEAIEVEADLALYAPALVHVMSDRPLYKPGQEVLLRSAVLRRSDSTPIEERPGTWTIRAPDGTEMMVEKVPTSEWGISATTFPLDSQAQVGRWVAVYGTGADQDTITFDVRPFELPRFTVELEPEERWFSIGDDLEVTGTARYTSGAPVANATVKAQVGASMGRWPIPLAWEEEVTLETDSEGRFSLDYGEVPADLLEAPQVPLTVSVVDEAGDSASTRTMLKLAVDSIAVSTVTELDGLVADFNNRAYLRVTQPDGRPLAKTQLTLTNPYDPTAPAQEAETDEDGVASIQLDPGAPVTIVDPPPPTRVRPFSPSEPALSSAAVSPTRRGLDLAERRVFDRAHAGISRCGVWTVGDRNVDVSMQVDGGGFVRDVLSAESPIGDCVASVMRRVRLPVTGDPRTYALTWRVPDSLQPHMQFRAEGAFGSSGPIDSAMQVAAAEARSCFSRGQGIDGAEVILGHWSVREGARAPSVLWDTATGTGLPAGVLACVERSMRTVSLEEPAKADAMGTARLFLDVPQPPGSVKPQATTRTGFELQVAAAADGSELGSTRVRFAVGNIPYLRIRATPALVSPGDEITFELLRGPTYSGELPEELELELYARGKRVAKADVDKDTRKATMVVPSDADGFMKVEWGGARSVVFVQPNDALSVALSTDEPVYRPGETAVLTVQTQAGGTPTSAAVSLAGVDQTLSQLAPLLAADDWGRITVRTTGADVFDRFGPRALQLGQIRGRNAALATVLKVQSLADDGADVAAVGAYASQSPDETEVLTTNFYQALEALVGKVREWEKTAPASEKLHPETVAGLWKAVLAEADAPLVDAYGRPLRLSVLPEDLLDQTEPRQVAADSRRLPEDVTNWRDWVGRNVK